MCAVGNLWISFVGVSCCIVFVVQGLRAQQHRDQEEVSGLLGVDVSTALLLLRSARWNKEDLLSKYMEDPEAVRTSSSLYPLTPAPKTLKPTPRGGADGRASRACVENAKLQAGFE